MARTDLEQLVYTMSADIRGMQRQLDRAVGDTDKASRKIERRIEEQGVNVGKALRNVFDSSKLKIIEDGASRISVFGRAIEPLGPLGIAAAAGVVALAEAFHQAREAIEFVDELHDTAEKLHVTTDALQEYRYAVRAAGGEEKGADDALEQFGVTLGKAQEGLAKSQKAFKALGFTQAQIKSWKTVEEALDAVTVRINQLGSNPQRDAITEQLGLTGMKELINQGVEGSKRLRDEAHTTGTVMDEELIRRSADLNDEFETAAKRVKVELASAFVSAGPALLALMKMAGDLAKFAADAADAFRSIQGKSDAGLDAKALQLSKEILILKAAQARGDGVSQLAIDNKVKELNDVQAERDRRTAERASESKIPKGNRSLVDQGGGPTAAEKRQRGLEALDSAMRSALQAQQNLTDNIEELARLKEQEIDAELKAKVDRLQGEINDHKIDEALAKQAILKEQQAAADQKALVRREAEEKLADRDWEAQQRRGALSDTILSIEESLARTVQARLAIERRALLARQEAEREAVEREFARQKSYGSYDPELADAERDWLQRKQATEMRGIETNAVRDLAGDFKSGLLDAFEALKTGGAAGVMDYLVDRFKRGLLDAFADALSQKFAASVINGGSGSILSTVASIFGFGKRAGGGLVAAGNPYVVGEKGKELFVPGVTGTIIPNHLLNAPRVGAQGSIAITQNIDAKGAFIAQDLLNYVDSKASQAVQTATIQSVAAASKIIPVQMGKKQRQRFR